MKSMRKIPALLLAATLLAATPSCAYADSENPSADDMRGAMMKLLKLDEILNKEPQPLQHSTVGESATAPEPPQAPQVAAPSVTPPKAPTVSKPAEGQLASAAPTLPEESAPAMPRPANPAATGTPKNGKIKINTPGKIAQNTNSNDQSGKTSGNGGGLKNVLPNFTDELTKPKPKSKLKTVSKPTPYKTSDDGDLDGDGVVEEHEANPQN